MKRGIGVVLVAVLMALGMAQNVTIGVNLELSGRFATYGATTLYGIEAALQQNPHADRIELIVCDNQTTVEGSVACANRFVDEGVLAVLGSFSSSMSIPAAQVLQDAGILMISTSSTNPFTTKIGDLIFRMAYADDFQGVVAARYAAEELGATRVAIFRQQDDDSFVLARFFQDEFEAGGGETLILDIMSNTVDFSAHFSDLRDFDPQVIYYSGFCAEGAALIVQLQQRGFDQQKLGAHGSDDALCIDEGGSAFDGYIYTGFGGPELLTGGAAERASDFREFYELVFPDADLNGFSLAGADSLNVIAEAISRAGSSDIGGVRDVLASIEGYTGVSGDITYAGTDGTPANRTIAFFEFDFDGGTTYEEVKTLLFGLQTGE